MESEEKSPDTCVTVILATHNHTVSVNKNKAIENSEYFRALLSGNFSDHNLKEHQIKFDISPGVFQSYIDWLNNFPSEVDKKIDPQPDKFLENVLPKNLPTLLDLLETSIFFMSEKLTDQLTKTVMENWLYPSWSIDVWEFAENLDLCILRDLALEVCLDRFNELPEEKLLGLPLKLFVELITNPNIEADQSDRKKLFDKFLQRNPIHPDQKHLIEIVDFEAKNNREYWPCVVIQKSDESKKKQYSVYCVKDRQLIELDELKPMLDSLDDGCEVAGRRIVARRTSIYLIGGEKGIGTGRFIKSIWRYCLISRNWYYVTELPTARRHMIAEFIDENLYLIGGCGRYRVRLSSVDIFNIYTNKWHKGEDIHDKFTETPLSCVASKQIIFYSGQEFYLYSQKSYKCVTELFHRSNDSCYALASDSESQKVYSFHSLFSKFDDPYDYSDIMICSSSLKSPGKSQDDEYEILPPLLVNKRFLRHIFIGSVLVSFSFSDENTISVEKGYIEDNNYHCIDSFDQQIDNITLPLFSNQLGCFNIINPKSLQNKLF